MRPSVTRVWGEQATGLHHEGLGSGVAVTALAAAKRESFQQFTGKI